MNRIVLFLSVLWLLGCTSASKSGDAVGDIPNSVNKQNHVDHNRDDNHESSNEIVQEGWNRVILEGIGYFDFPINRLEIQEASLMKAADSVEHVVVISDPPAKFFLQQHGRNDPNNKEEYVRVMLETFSGNTGDFLTSDVRPEDLTKKEQDQIIEYYKNDLAKNFENAGIKIVKWFPVEYLQINGSFCVLLNYIRYSVVEKGDVHVRLYCFPNNDKEFDFTLSCREKDDDNWQDIFNEIVASFTLVDLNN